jgi:hypothetical protein
MKRTIVYSCILVQYVQRIAARCIRQIQISTCLNGMDNQLRLKWLHQVHEVCGANNPQKPIMYGDI